MTERAHAIPGGHGRVAASRRVVTHEWARCSPSADEGLLQRLPNGEIFQKAGREQRVVLTFDLDFGEILAASGGQLVSVILFGCGIRGLLSFFNALLNVLKSRGRMSHGAIVIVEDGRHRVRKLPLGS